jgi:hypothetical protein
MTSLARTTVNDLGTNILNRSRDENEWPPLISHQPILGYPCPGTN